MIDPSRTGRSGGGASIGAAAAIEDAFVLAFAAGLVLAFGLGFACDLAFDLALGFAAEVRLPFTARFDVVVGLLDFTAERGVRAFDLDAWVLVFLAAAIAV